MQLITMQTIARSALATLYNTIVLTGLVNRDYDASFNGKQGDTITVRRPATFVVNEFDRANGIVLQNPGETSFTVSLDTLLDVSFPITTEELTLELDDFEERLLNPALEAFAQDIDGRLARRLVEAANANGGGGVVSGTGNSPGERHKAFREARKVLSRNKLPLTDRYGVLSPEGVAAITGDQLVLQANTSGSTQALVDGSVGRLSGFNNYETQTLGFGPGDAGQADGVAFHKSAVALVTRTLEKPMGLPPAQVSVENYKGLGIRVIKDWDSDKKQDVISLDMLIGTKVVRPQAAVELDFGQGS